MNLFFKLVPRPFTMAMMASEMPAAINIFDRGGAGLVGNEPANDFHPENLN